MSVPVTTGSVNALTTEAWILAGRVAAALGVFLAFWIAAQIAGRLIGRLTRAKLLSEDLVLLLGRTAKILLLIFGAVTALGTAGVNVSAMVAGLGLTGFALGFALRDILSNYLAGILLLVYRPFTRGDRITVAGLEGDVSAIDLRYTLLRKDGSLILIPNSNLFTNPIVITRGAEPHAVTASRPIA
jgi:small-conductance mechanosensitive channel